MQLDFEDHGYIEFSMAADNVTQSIAEAQRHMKTIALAFFDDPIPNQAVNQLDFGCKSPTSIRAFSCIIVMIYSVLKAVNGAISYSILCHYYLQMYLSIN